MPTPGGPVPPGDRAAVGVNSEHEQARMTSPVVLKLEGVTKRFGKFTALDGIDLDIRDGEFLTIVGPSGSGKTTMIRLLVGMDEPTDGVILLKGEVINQVPAHRRPTCMVFQSLALFPHKTVGQNIEFPLKIKGIAPDRRRERALELLGSAGTAGAIITAKVSCNAPAASVKE